MNIKATIVPFQQGTPEWAQHRSRSLNASELAVAMGISSNMQRNELIRCKATGIQFEHSDFVEKRVFAPGHQYEAIARPWAEEIIGEDLYCSVFAAEVDGLLLSASLDGHTLLNDVTMEHKQLNDALAASLDRGIIPDEFHPQMEQGFMLTGATRCLFMASKGSRETMRFCWYESNPELRAKIIPTWKQFMADVAAYVPTEAEVKPTGKAPETLPALHIVIQGGVSASNLDEFKETALGAIRSVNRELTTDVHFADAEKAVKWCSDIEDRIKAAKDHALSQTASIDALFRTMDEISAEARRVRLDLDKLVKARKESMKADIVASGVAAMAKHIRELNASMPANYMPVVPADFGGAIKGLRTIDSITNAVDTELARVKIAANEIANRIHANVKTLQESGLVVHDTAALVLKAPDDLAAAIAQRVAAEKAKEEAQRERIRAEEAARLEREASEAQAQKTAMAMEEIQGIQQQVFIAVTGRGRRVGGTIECIRETLAETEAWKIEESNFGMFTGSAQAAKDKAVSDIKSMLTKAEERAHAAQVEADRIAREQAEAVSAARIREEQAAAPSVQTYDNGAPMYSTTTFKDNGQPIMLTPDGKRSIFCDVADDEEPADNGARLTLGQLNDRLSPVSINVAGLHELGFDPVEQVKASRLYKASDIRSICIAISNHLNKVSCGDYLESCNA